MERNSELKAVKWVGIASALLVSVLTTLVATGVVPQEGLWAGLVSAAIAVATTVSKYTQTRGEKKVAEALMSVDPPSGLEQ